MNQEEKNTPAVSTYPDESFEDFTYEIPDPDIATTTTGDDTFSQKEVNDISPVDPLPDLPKLSDEQPVYHSPRHAQWLERQKKNENFTRGILSAYQWNKLLEHDLKKLPEEFHNQLFSADYPIDWQTSDVAGDVSAQWTKENLPQVAEHPDDIEDHWEDIRESLANEFSVPNTNEGIYSEISRRNKEFTDSISVISSIRKEAISLTLKGEKGIAEEKRNEWESSLNKLPEEVKNKSHYIIELAEKDAIRQKNRLKPIYDSVRSAVNRMETFEDAELTPAFPEGVDFIPGSPTVPVPRNILSLKGSGKIVFDLNKQLRTLSKKDRALVFEMVEEHIIEERENKYNSSTKEEKDSENGLHKLMHKGVARSMMKPLYGAANVLGGYYAFLTDITADSVEWTGLDDDLVKVLRQDANEIREDIAQVQQMRDIMETRLSPLKPKEDGRGAPPDLHWAKQCLVGFSEESVAIALALSAPTALIGYGATQAGNHYAKGESNRQKKNDNSGEIVPEENSLAHGSRFLSALASGTIQTAIEASAYGKTFTPLIKSLPTTSKALGIFARPYAEQKGISLTQPLGETIGNYGAGLATNGKEATFESSELLKALGTGESNVMDYLATLPFVLLAAGKVKLGNFKSRSSIVDDPKLASYYNIPSEKIDLIRKEKNPDKQNSLLQRALRESPIWENPNVLRNSAEMLNASEFSISAPNEQWHKYSAESLGELLDIPKDKLLEIVSKKGIPTAPGTIKPSIDPSSFPGKTAKERFQKLCQAQANLPTLEPSIKGKNTFWKLKFTQDLPQTHPGYYLKEQRFSSLEDALTNWQDEVVGNTMFHRNNAFKLTDDSFLTKSAADKENAIKSLVEELKTLAPQRALLVSNNSQDSFTGARALKNLLRKEQEKTTAHTIEDALLYASNIPPEQITAHRVSKMWLEEINSKRISKEEASSWISIWEANTQDKLRATVPHFISDNTPNRELAGKLTELTLYRSGAETMNILPPAFSEPARIVQEQLSHSSSLASKLPETSYFSSQLESSHDGTTALSRTLSAYLDQPWERSIKHFSAISKSKTKNILIPDTPPEIPKHLLQDIKWLDEQGLSPLFSITDPKTNLPTWVTRYPDGSFSQKHSNPQSAIMDWVEKGKNIHPHEMDSMGTSATNSLFEFYESPRNSTGNFFSLMEDSTKIADPNSSHIKERKNIYFLQNPHMKGLEDSPFEIAGTNSPAISPLGHISQEINVYHTTNPLVMIEEQAEAVWANQFRKKALSLEQAKKELLKLGEITGETYLPQNIDSLPSHVQTQNVIEGLSQASREYMLTQHSNELLPSPVRQWINHSLVSPNKSAHEIPMLRRSTLMKKSQESINPDFLDMIQESVGLNPLVHQERLFNANKFPQRESVIPLLKRPQELFDILPESAQNDLLVQLKSSLNSKTDLPPAHLWMNYEQQVKRTPDLLQWDYNPKTKLFTHSKDWGKSKKDTSFITESQLPEHLKNKDLNIAIKTGSHLRRCMDNLPYTSEFGIHHKSKIFSRDSNSRPGKMPEQWNVEELSTERGLRYTPPKEDGQVIRLAGGNLYYPHKGTRLPYVRHTVNGHYLNAQGDICSPYSPESYIPLEEYSFRSPKNNPQLAIPPNLTDELAILTKPDELQKILNNPDSQHVMTSRDLIFHLKEVARHSSLDQNQNELLKFILHDLEKIPEVPNVPAPSLEPMAEIAETLIRLRKKKNKK